MVHGFWACWLVLLTAAERATVPACTDDLQSFVQVPQDAHIKRRAAFDFLWRRYFSHWQKMKGPMLSMPHLKPHELTIQFEIELPPRIYHLPMTPELLLLRGRIGSPDLSTEDVGGIFLSSGPWWNVELDGTGNSHSQTLQAIPEPNSAVVHPQAVLNGSVPSALEEFLEKNHVTKMQRPFQFTVGLPLERARDLLQRTPFLHVRVHSTADFCTRKPKPCSRRYEGLLLLCQMVLDQAVKASECGLPKRFQKPWLLRTHVGDLVKTLHEDERQGLAKDVLKLWGPDQQLYPKGIMDYLQFPEMAEIGGIVKKRFGPSGNATVEMPTDLDGLKKVAAMMLEKNASVSKLLRDRPCAVNAPGNKTWAAPTAREWLEGLQQGLDLMSDHDSPASHASLGKTLWKSMGSWRWSTEEPRIFLECRSPRACLGRPNRWPHMSYRERLQAAARMVDEVEQISKAESH
eukprot:Skav228174  [mRNA]  locus=scaffold3933:44910:46289:+ [translate_table: standard]